MIERAGDLSMLLPAFVNDEVGKRLAAGTSKSEAAGLEIQRSALGSGGDCALQGARTS